jgi:hypothetical protein
MMPRYLGLALFAEGPRDHRFLVRLLGRVAEEICAREATMTIEIGNVLELESPPDLEADRATRITEAAREAFPAWNVLFIHSDSGGNAERAREQQVDPARIRVEQEFNTALHRCVAVVPIRETEAWALADGDALRDAFGTSLDNIVLGIPTRPRDVEHVLDPKKALENAFRTAQGGRRSRRHKPGAPYLERIADSVRLDVLAQLPAFSTFRQEFTTALQDLNYV